MKRFGILAVIMAVLGLASCEKAPSKAVVGTWGVVKVEISAEGGIGMTVDVAEMGRKLEITFNDDGTGNTYEEYKGSGVRSPFTYSVNGNMLYVTDDGETEGILMTIDKNKMTLEVENEFFEQERGKLRVYQEKVK